MWSIDQVVGFVARISQATQSLSLLTSVPPLRIGAYSFASLVMFFSPATVNAQMNSWTNRASAPWHSNYWSLGVLPQAGQSVSITNSGFKAVGIWPATVSGFAGSLTVSNLALKAPADSQNTLLLNFSNSDVPLRIRNGFTIGTNSSLVSIHGGLQVDGIAGGGLTIRGGKMIQEGGTTVATNVATSVLAGSINVTNASLWFGSIALGDEASVMAGSFTQSGGKVSAVNLWVTNGAYNLMGGALSSGGTAIDRWETGSATFSQSGGTNAGNVILKGGSAAYRLLGGLLHADGVRVEGQSQFFQSGGIVNSVSNWLGGPYRFYGEGNYFLSNGLIRCQTWTMLDGRFHQYGGQHHITNEVALIGDYRDDHGYVSKDEPKYFLSGGIMSAESLSLGEYSSFNQSGGTNRIVGNVTMERSTFVLDAGSISSGGLLLRSRSGYGAATFEQSGGSHVISGVLSNFHNGYSYGGVNTYLLSGGGLTAPSIVMRGNNTAFVASNNPAINNISFDFGGGMLRVHGSAQFGQLRLSSNSRVEFPATASRVRFLNSSGVAWSADAVLNVHGWAGTSEGGGVHQLYIGDHIGGLTPAQLAQVRFVNPAGMLRGAYPAAILGTGETVMSRENSILLGGWANAQGNDPGSSDYWDSLIIYPGFSTNVVAISAGSPNLALRADGTVLTWGTGLPIPPELNHGLIAISASPFHSLALRSNGTVVAWGYQYDGTRTNAPTGLSNVVAISAGHMASLALRADGSIIGWGEEGGIVTNIPAAAMPAIAISAGAAHALALKADGTVVGWGQSTYGEAEPPPGLSNVVAIEAGYFGSFALKSDGTVVAWGYSYHGQTNVPPGLSNVVAISAGGDDVVALKNDGTVVAWGSTNTLGYTGAPRWLSNVRAISVGGGYTLVLLHGGPLTKASLSAPARSNGIFHVSSPVRSGHVYALEYVTDVVSSDWRISLPLIAGKPGANTLIDPSAAASQRFYRVREW